MRILLLGSGGREHAFAWKMTQSPACEKLFVAPGNAGTESCATNLDFSVNDFEKVKKCCLAENIDMVVVGPEEPLVKGIVDFLQGDERLKDLMVIGPSKAAAQLEGSKAFAKSFMDRHSIPTADYKEFTLDNYEEGVKYLQQHTLPIVLKADGLASGKGVLICQNYVEALAEFELIIQLAKFGDAGKKVVVEEFLNGIELSVFILSDGKNYVILPEAKDYKRAKEGDKGPNTGGMGAVSPILFADEEFMKKVEEKIIKPTIKGLQKDELIYKGFIFFGLMKTGDEPYLIEYNCRMGDPETEVVLPRLKNDLVELLKATAVEKLNEINIDIESRITSTVVAVSGGYPNLYETGFEIAGLEDVDSTSSILFHAATKKKNGKVITNGGRVFCITSFGDTVWEAVNRSKKELSKISFEDMSYRKDIGFEFY